MKTWKQFLESVTWQDLEANPPPSEEEEAEKGKPDPYHDRREVYRANQKQLFRQLKEEINKIVANLRPSKHNELLTLMREKIFPLWEKLDTWQRSRFVNILQIDIQDNMWGSWYTVLKRQIRNFLINPESTSIIH